MNIISDINRTLSKVFKAKGYEESLAFCTYSDKPELSDFQCNASFQIAKSFKKNPLEIAEGLAELLNKENDGFEYSFVRPAFINIKFKNETMLSYLKVIENDNCFGIEKEKAKKIIIDYGGPNISKPLHVGHLRSAVIGESIKRIAKFIGHEVISDIYLGDWGFPMGLVIASLIEKGQTQSVTNEELNVIYPAASKRSKEDEEFKNKALEITKLLQAKKQPYYDIWKMIKKVSCDGMLNIYNKLNVKFDLWKGESDADPYLPKMEDILNKKGVLEESQGALIVEVKEESDKEPMPPVRIKNAAGAYLYESTDLATILRRREEYNPDEMWYVTDYRQNLHFVQVFRAAKKAGFVSDVGSLSHTGYGTMNGPDGKPFKTRDGDAVKLENLIEMVNESVKTKMKESGREVNEDAEKIGIAAIKFGDLINLPQKDYVFDPEKFCSFEGKTGPYILYTIVRIKSILAKLETKPKLSNIRIEGSLRDSVINIFRFGNDFKEAHKLKAPSFIAASIYSLAASVNAFYNNTRILKESDETLKLTYAKILEIAVGVLETGCEVLAIEVPERM